MSASFNPIHSSSDNSFTIPCLPTEWNWSVISATAYYSDTDMLMSEAFFLNRNCPNIYYDFAYAILKEHKILQSTYTLPMLDCIGQNFRVYHQNNIPDLKAWVACHKSIWYEGTFKLGSPLV